MGEGERKSMSKGPAKDRGPGRYGQMGMGRRRMGSPMAKKEVVQGMQAKPKGHMGWVGCQMGMGRGGGLRNGWQWVSLRRGREQPELGQKRLRVSALLLHRPGSKKDPLDCIAWLIHLLLLPSCWQCLSL